MDPDYCLVKEDYSWSSQTEETLVDNVDTEIPQWVGLTRDNKIELFYLCLHG